jgi:hypothetical protein
VKYGLGEQWQIVAVRRSRAEAAAVAAHGFAIADPVGRLPTQVRVHPRPI